MSMRSPPPPSPNPPPRHVPPPPSPAPPPFSVPSWWRGGAPDGWKASGPCPDQGCATKEYSQRWWFSSTTAHVGTHPLGASSYTLNLQPLDSTKGLLSSVTVDFTARAELLGVTGIHGGGSSGVCDGVGSFGYGSNKRNGYIGGAASGDGYGGPGNHPTHWQFETSLRQQYDAGATAEYLGFATASYPHASDQQCGARHCADQDVMGICTSVCHGEHVDHLSSVTWGPDPSETEAQKNSLCGYPPPCPSTVSHL